MKILKIYSENGYKYYLLDGINRYEIIKAEYSHKHFRIMIEYRDNEGRIQVALIREDAFKK